MSGCVLKEELCSVVDMHEECRKIIGVGNGVAGRLNCRAVAFVKMGTADYN